MKCKCELEFSVKKLNPDCEVHDESDVYLTLVERLTEERENILSALGEHPDSPVDIAQRISDIRDEGRAHFHVLTQTQENLRDAQRKVRELASETCRLNGKLSSEISRNEDLKSRVKKFEEEYVHQNLLLECQDKLRKAEEQLGLRQRERNQLANGLSKRQQSQSPALNCTKCGSTIHTDSFHSDRCPNGY